MLLYIGNHCEIIKIIDKVQWNHIDERSWESLGVQIECKPIVIL